LHRKFGVTNFSVSVSVSDSHSCLVSNFVVNDFSLFCLEKKYFYPSEKQKHKDLGQELSLSIYFFFVASAACLQAELVTLLPPKL